MGKLNLEQITLVSVCGNAQFLMSIIKAAKHCMNYVNFNSVKILSNVDVNISDIDVIKIPPLDKEKYSRFCLYELPEYIQTDFCLTFQGDGFIINTDMWSDEFLQYDYIGAPWVFDTINRVGNGGFSLRSQKFLHSAKTLEYNSKIQFQEGIEAGILITPEDWFACSHSYKNMIDMGVKFADIDTAYRFSVEHPSPNKAYDRKDIHSYNSFGFHGSFNTAAMNLLDRKDERYT